MEYESLNQHYLYPAALYASDEECIVTTVLGSCVAVCLFDKTTNIGGINHFMLPYWNGQGLSSPKYGNIAIPKLIDKLASLGVKKSHLIAKVFGGGEVIEASSQIFNIGVRNIALAEELLHELKIPIVARSVGGKNGRKITFNTKTGEVKQKLITTKRLDLSAFHPDNAFIKKLS